MKTTTKTVCSTRWNAEHFTDLYDFMETVSSRTDNKHRRALDNDGKLSTAMLISDYATTFTGTESWDDSIRLMNGGYTEGLRMIEALPKMERDPKPRRRIFADVTGVAPHIPNVIMDVDPRDMWNIKRVPQKSNEINIYYDRTVSWDKTEEEVAKSARLMLDTIAAIEKAGTKVNLYIMCSVCDNGNREYINCIINLKKASQHINPLMMAYPLVHTSFLRRQMFRWMDTTPIVSYRSTVKVHGYNNQCSNKRYRQKLIDAGIITDQDYYIRCESVIYYTSIDRLIEDMNEQSELKTARAI